MRKADLGPLAAVAALCMVLAGPTAEPAAAQTPPPAKPKAETTRAERAAAQAARRKQMLERNALIRQKRAACLQERIEKKIPLFERPKFIRDCMAR